MGLLKPSRTSGGQRCYRESDARRLAHIMIMRSCGLPLTTIRLLLENDADVHRVLTEHLSHLYAQEASIQHAIARTKAALARIEGITAMDSKSAFEAMKEQGITDFEATYGKEARERYGNDAIDASNERMRALTQDEWDAKELLEESIKVQLRLAMTTGDPTSDASAELAHMHARWIRIHWGEKAYSREAHLGLAQMYLTDDRFRTYYDSAAGDGATDFLVSALQHNL